jgi:hypothetical protein
VLGIAGGLHLTLQLPPGCDADRVADTARSEEIDIRIAAVGVGAKDVAALLGSV